MQSSIGLALRALIMLGFLIIVPGIAIFGGAFPDVIRSLIASQLERTQSTANKGAPQQIATLPAAPPYQPLEYGRPGPGNPVSRPPQAPPLFSQPNQQNASHPHLGHTAAGRAPDLQGSTGYATPASFQQALPPASVPPQFQPQPSAAEPPQAMNLDVGPPPSAPPGDVAAQAAPPSQPLSIDSVQQRLQQLGASFYRLEKMGDSGELFRFSCHMPWGVADAGDRVFQAIEPSPELAMTQVLSEVEAWRR